MSNTNAGGKTPTDATDAQPAISAPAPRNRITDRAELNDTVTQATVLADVALAANLPKSHFYREFTKLHNLGFIYPADDVVLDPDDYTDEEPSLLDVIRRRLGF